MGYIYGISGSYNPVLYSKALHCLFLYGTIVHPIFDLYIVDFYNHILNPPS
jgi:hypothetical protein